MNELLLMVGGVCLYLTPIAMVAGSKRSKGHEKNGWLIGTLLFSWVALLLYITMIPKTGRVKTRRKKHS
ncbi:hypothetical protein [Pseudoalteromonas luteoviolacea]|uniref:Cardiolipin synthase N-terminal domain-containing protein n=1 Tax=Pseudoalteromonas luteoviolacea S4054 TaxID=1129367 RepID=A0A0F6A6N1_9GAMM|nr:hypothetical protein [Pseudoalteromonas luteoviolacea]KKE81104.1 hypothetical protein N479_03620 [Pseudoalteromonas luteoviolacea S4054]KZN62488.1 hypothetical protein N481_03315 [Pseudoalteromonas luteoviolacea S4047-1]